VLSRIRLHWALSTFYSALLYAAIANPNWVFVLMKSQIFIAVVAERIHSQVSRVTEHIGQACEPVNCAISLFNLLPASDKTPQCSSPSLLHTLAPCAN
jgi:hypothetical protein